MRLNEKDITVSIRQFNVKCIARSEIVGRDSRETWNYEGIDILMYVCNCVLYNVIPIVIPGIT